MTTYEIDGSAVRFVTEGYAGFKQYTPWFGPYEINEALKPFTFCSIDTCDPVLGPILSILEKIQTEADKIEDLIEWAGLDGMAAEDAAQYHTYAEVRDYIEELGIDLQYYDEGDDNE